MTETPTKRDPGADSVAAVRAAVDELGAGTAAAVGARAGLAYSTTTPKLRALEEAGEAERFRADDNRTLWRLTDTGRAALANLATNPADSPDSTATAPGPASDSIPAPEPADGPTLAPESDAPADAAPTTTHADESTPAMDVAAAAAGAQAAPTAEDPESAPEPDGQATAPAAPAVTGRRAKGTLDGAVLDVLEGEPGRVFTVSELCKLIDKANEGAGVRKASPGAVVLAAQRLVRRGRAVLAVEHPASFQLLQPA